MGTFKVRVVGAQVGGAEREVEDRLASVVGALSDAGHPAEPWLLDVTRGVPGAESWQDTGAFLCASGDGRLDGATAAVLHGLGVPSVGTPWLSLAVGQDALRTRELLRAYNVPTLAYYRARPGSEASLMERHGSFGFPARVLSRSGRRPRLVGHVSDLVREVNGREPDDVVIERAAHGERLIVAVLQGQALGMSGQRGEPVGSWLSEGRRAGILRVAERAAQALDGAGAALVTLDVSQVANEAVLGVELCPVLHAHSPFVRTARDAGYALPELCDALIRGHIARSGGRRRQGVRSASARCEASAGARDISRAG